MYEIVSHFQPDEPSAYYDCIRNLVSAEILFYCIGVVNVPECEDSLGINAIQWRLDRVGARREQELVVALDISFRAAALCIGLRRLCAFYGDLLLPGVDAYSFAFSADLDVEAAAE